MFCVLNRNPPSARATPLRQYAPPHPQQLMMHPYMMSPGPPLMHMPHVQPTPQKPKHKVNLRVCVEIKCLPNVLQTSFTNREEVSVSLKQFAEKCFLTLYDKYSATSTGCDAVVRYTKMVSEKLFSREAKHTHHLLYNDASLGDIFRCKQMWSRTENCSATISKNCQKRRRLISF